MNIRIGNDVKVTFAISNFGHIDEKDIRCAHCTFVRKKISCNDVDDQLPIFEQYSLYTIRNCGDTAYNVLPHNTNVCHCNPNPHNCGFVVCDGKHDEFKTKCKIVNGDMVACFPAEVLKCEGSYDCIFELKVFEADWDFDHIHTYTTSCEDAFSITKSKDGAIGSITIKLDSEEADTYILYGTDEYIQTYKDNYVQLAINATKLYMDNADVHTETMDVVGTNNRIVVFSKYNSLKFVYSMFNFPMNMYKLNDNIYMYISNFTYSDKTITLHIKKTDTPNLTIPGLPFEDNEAEPDDPTQDVPEPQPNVNAIDADILRLVGLVNLSTLYTTGKYNNPNLIL